MLSINRINYFFITITLLVYLLTRANDIYVIIHGYLAVQHSLIPTGLSFAKLLSGIQWLNNNMINVHNLGTLSQSGNLEIFLGKVSGYGNLLSTFLCLIWVICLTFKSRNTIKSTQILLLGYMLFAFIADFLAYRLPILLGDVNTSNPVILAGVFVLAHGCEIIRELTYSDKTVTLIKTDICLILAVSIIMILLAFQFNIPLAAYSMIILLHIYSAFTVSKRKIYQARTATYIKIAVVLYIFIDTATTIFYLNHDAAGIKLATYLIDYCLYPFAHLLFILSEYGSLRVTKPYPNRDNQIISN